MGGSDSEDPACEAEGPNVRNVYIGTLHSMIRPPIGAQAEPHDQEQLRFGDCLPTDRLDTDSVLTDSLSIVIGIHMYVIWNTAHFVDSILPLSSFHPAPSALHSGSPNQSFYCSSSCMFPSSPRLSSRFHVFRTTPVVEYPDLDSTYSGYYHIVR
jgi:hypothetical protein